MDKILEALREAHPIFKNAIQLYGQMNQKFVAIEELSEVQKELCKDLRGKLDEYHMSEEIADAYIMLYQLGMMYKNYTMVSEIITEKAERLKGRMSR